MTDPAPTRRAAPSPPPPRELSLAGLAAATYFIVSGGPYGLEEVVRGHGYARTLLLLAVLPLVWSLPVALLVGELGAALPRTGGFYVWVRRGLGPFWGLQEAWLSLAAGAVDNAIYPTLLVGYLGALFPGLGLVPERGLGLGLSLGVVVLCAGWNLAGIRAVGLGAAAAAALMLSPFLALAVLAALAVLRGGAAPVAAALAAPPPAAGPAFSAGLLQAMWNYMGWDNASTFAGEVRAPQRTYPRAMWLSLAAVAAAYLAAVLAGAASGLPAAAWRDGAWVEVARALGGGGLAVAVAAGGAVSAVTMFAALLLSWSRLAEAVAADGWLPAPLARRSPRTHVPTRALSLGAALSALCLGLGLERLIALDVLLYGASLLLELAALVALRLREPALPRPFRVPGGLPGVLALAALPVGLLAYAASGLSAETRVLGLGPFALAAALAAVGPVWYLAGRRRSRRSRVADEGGADEGGATG
ncbi:APC family permease [Anaeromyxobacter paludicola]|uniref:Amino acid/polyamine/organocation transporter, APC superfamily n=1 Tax=Anaeromyxobacter paludicola TaxID=2918171 RepID=A0ABN6NET2_9BACT|nr:APC family permease [Anaeromyxobacter paludicola]BDG10694.1 hypothetical protein AMPC_38070 [Anaeromyxobacter paludicola]